MLDENGQRIPTGETTIVEETVYTPTPYSFCLPYELTFSNNVHLFTPTYVSEIGMHEGEAQVSFERKEDGVAEAWTPYYALVDADFVSLSTEEHVTLVPDPHIVIEASKANFEGTAVAIQRSTKDAYLLQDDKTWRKEGDVIPPFRAYFCAKPGCLETVECLKPFVGIDLYDNRENSPVIKKHDGLTLDVILKDRTINRTASWITLCLPFDLADFNGTPLEGAIVKTLSSSSFDAETGTMTLDFEEVTSVKAGKPYIVRWMKNDTPIKNPTFTDVTINKQVKSIKTDAVTFCGTFDPIKLEANDRTKLYMGSSNTLYYPSGEVPVNSFRGYFQLADGITAGDVENGTNARVFVLNFGEESTVVREIEHVGNEATSTWYTIDGSKLSGCPTRSGIYINNGQKVIVK